MVKMRRIQGRAIDVLGLAVYGASCVGAFCWILGAETGRRPFPNMVAWTGQEGGGTERKREREGERAA